nr:PLP-dependent aminotransferase family protein [uncultured Aminipila sp.]
MLDINRTSKQSLYEQIYLQIKNDILNGIIKPDSRLLPTRTLAAELHLGRNTVTLAYHQLEIEGYIRAATGSGFYVNPVSTLTLVDNSNSDFSPCHTPVETKILKANNFDFQYGSIDTNIFPINTWRKCMIFALDSIVAQPALTYMDKQGDLRLRTAIAHYLYQARGVQCSSEQVVITSGHQQSLQILTKLFPNQQYSFSMEEPGYDGTRVIFEANNYNINPILLEDDGINIDELSKLDTTLLYVTPSHQFPTGSVLPIMKRLSILAWANNNNSYIIEDDYDSELRYNMLPIPSLQSLDKNMRTIYLGTFSKSLSPDFRISYMVLPKNIYKKYNQLFKLTNCTVPKILQIALSEFFENGYFEKHQNILKTYYKKKHELLCYSIKNIFKKDATIHGSSAGLHILLSINCSYNQTELIEKASNNGVTIYPIDIYWIQKNRCPKNQIMLGFGSIRLEDIPIAIKELHEAILG